MSIHIDNPQQEEASIITFLKNTFNDQHVTNAVIAVSGGIDSALALTLLTKALGEDHVFPILLPYGNQSMTDAQIVCDFNNISNENILSKNIKESVDQIASELSIDSKDFQRKGNIMARVRMIYVFDLAKKLQALVCGTENKSEKYLGYFTRFGDGASDIEPIEHLYKTQVRELAMYMHIPKEILEKEPSAGLWENQTDEHELGFSYEDADQVIDHVLSNAKEPLTSVSLKVIEKVQQTMQKQAFKRNVPYVKQ